MFLFRLSALLPSLLLLPSRLYNPKEVNCLLHIVCITYSLIFVYYQLVCLEKVATAVRHRKLN